MGKPAWVVRGDGRCVRTVEREDRKGETGGCARRRGCEGLRKGLEGRVKKCEGKSDCCYGEKWGWLGSKEAAGVREGFD